MMTIKKKGKSISENFITEGKKTKIGNEFDKLHAYWWQLITRKSNNEKKKQVAWWWQFKKKIQNWFQKIS